MKAQNLEWTILKAIARARPDDWLPCSLGDLRVRMRDIEAEALNASMNSIVEACIFLLENGHILLGKREGGGKRLPFDLQKQSDEGYLSNFFGRGSFELKLTHQGRKHLEETEASNAKARPASVGAPAATTTVSENGSDQSHDVFISHASEDKEYCGPLVEALEKAGIRVWFDKTALKWGDDLRSAIDRGLRNCRYGIVIFSKAFLRRKKWTEYELSSLFALEKVGENRILPIWHGITHEDLLDYSAGLADRLAKVSSSDTYEDIVNSLCEMLGRPASDAPHKVNATAKVERGEGRERVQARRERTRTIVPAQKRPGILRSPSLAASDLTAKEIELLWSAVKEPGDILHNVTSDGESIRVNGRQFLAGADRRIATEWIGAFRGLEKRGFVEPLSHGSDFFRVTSDGYEAADALEEFARWDAKSVVLRAPYIGRRADELTLSCTGVIALPVRYFDDQIGADEPVQRSLREPPSLIVEGVSSRPVLTWRPTEIEFFDQTNQKVQSFRVDGMKFLKGSSLKLPLAAETVRGASQSANDALDELFIADRLPAAEEATAAEAGSESKPDGFLHGTRDSWVRFLQRCWPIIGSQILSIAREPASTIDDVRRAFLPAKEHPYDSGLATHFYRERIQQATAADVVNTGIRLDSVGADVIQATADREQAARSCTEAEAALGLATNPKDKEHVQRVVQQRREDLAELDAKLLDLQQAQKQLDEMLLDQQAYVSRSEMLDFLRSAEPPIDPRHIANAAAALPRKTWRESVTLCSQIPFDSYVEQEYQVFLVISAILNDRSSDFGAGSVEVFQRALLKLSPDSPGRQIFWNNFGDLKSAIEEFGNSSLLDPFRLTDLFLKKARRQKNQLENVLADSERLRE